MHKIISLWQIDSLKLLSIDLEKQLVSLKASSKPTKEEVIRLKELETIICAEEKEIERLLKGSKQLKEKVLFFHFYSFAFMHSTISISTALLHELSTSYDFPVPLIGIVHDFILESPNDAYSYCTFTFKNKYLFFNCLAWLLRFFISCFQDTHAWQEKT